MLIRTIIYIQSFQIKDKFLMRLCVIQSFPLRSIYILYIPHCLSHVILLREVNVPLLWLDLRQPFFFLNIVVSKYQYCFEYVRKASVSQWKCTEKQLHCYIVLHCQKISHFHEGLCEHLVAILKVITYIICRNTDLRYVL